MNWSTDMKRAILFGLGLLTVACLPAGAADMAARIPAKAPVMAPEPAWNWTGFYIGVNGGYGWANSTHTDVFGVTTGSFKQNGGLIGGTIGYNWQTSPAVLGLEGDLDWASINGSSVGCFSGSCF